MPRHRTARPLWILGVLLSGYLVAADVRAADQKSPEAIDIGSRRELFVDRTLIDKLNGVELRLHTPHDEGVAVKFDHPWEGIFSGYATIIKDGDLYRAYYRGMHTAGADGSSEECTCVAESSDGMTWTKPKLGLYEADGSKDNNIVLAGMAPFSHNFCPMLDTRAGVPAEQRYKALAGTRTTGLMAFASPDGLRWTKLRDAAVITDGAFDSQNVPFWSESEQKYLCYFRDFKEGFRRIKRAESTDFLNWSEPVWMEYGGQPVEHLYTNQTHTYFRAPHIYVAIAARFFPDRQVLNDEQAKKVGVHPKYFNDCSDGIFMTTRGGDQYDRSFMDGFLRPGIGLENWVSRTNYPALNVVPITPETMAIYANQNYGQPTAHLRRYSLRTDGFVSANAGYNGGELLTHPVVYSGRELSINFATSAAGEIHVELQDSSGHPLPGFTQDDSVRAIGNEIERTVIWKSGSDVGSLAGKPVRLRFVLKDADLYSFQFHD